MDEIVLWEHFELGGLSVFGNDATDFLSNYIFKFGFLEVEDFIMIAL